MDWERLICGDWQDGGALGVLPAGCRDYAEGLPCWVAGRVPALHDKGRAGNGD